MPKLLLPTLRPRKCHLRQTMLPLHLFTPTNPGHYPNNHGLMNQENSTHTNRALLNNTVTVLMARMRVPLLTQNYPVRTWTWTYPTS
jgi:hypothetical protein